MKQHPTVWGLQMPVNLGASAIDEKYVAISWERLGDLRQYPDREALKRALERFYPEDKARSRPISAGVLFRFAYEMAPGDLIVFPSKHDRMVNIGRVTGEYKYAPDDIAEFPNRRSVEWQRSIPRDIFSQSALNEIGAYLTLFLIKGHADEFSQKAGVALPPPQKSYADLIPEEPEDDTAATASISNQAEMSTSDFVIRQIMSELSGYQFELLVAHLLECMGYNTRVTQRSGDGGVDVIAHRDKLGFEPPIAKVQCKRTTAAIGRPEVDQLLGTLGEGEYGLFVTLGSFNRQTVELERNRPKLRLIDGKQFVELFTQHYAQLAPRYRTLIPLKQIYVPDLQD